VGGVGVEGLELDLAQRPAVDGVGKLGAELLDVELVGAAPDLLVGCEPDHEVAVLDLGVLDQDVDGGHDLGAPGLVVGAEERRPVGRYDVHADVATLEVGVLGGEDDLRRVAGQHDVAALVVLVHDGLDAGAGHHGRGVGVRDEPDRGHFLGLGGGEVRGHGAHHVAVLVDRRVLHAEVEELLVEHAQEVPLLLGAGKGLGVVVGARVDLDVAEKAFEQGLFGRIEAHGSVSSVGV